MGRAPDGHKEALAFFFLASFLAQRVGKQFRLYPAGFCTCRMGTRVIDLSDSSPALGRFGSASHTVISEGTVQNRRDACRRGRGCEPFPCGGPRSHPALRSDGALSAVEGSCLQPKQTVCQGLSRGGRENLGDVERSFVLWRAERGAPAWQGLVAVSGFGLSF